ncbi:hypothetical protein Tco_0501059, partial [Tanacetum coccineum]
MKDEINGIDLNNSFANLINEEIVLNECIKESDVGSSVKVDGKDKVVTEKVKVQEEGSLWERFKAGQAASTSKPKSTFLDLEDETDEDEVYMPDVMPGGGFLDGLEDDLDCY